MYRIQFTTPVDGQQGYIITGTNATNQTSAANQAYVNYSTINLSYGVWMVIGQIGYQNVTGGTTATLTTRFFGISGSSGAVTNNYASRQSHSISMNAGISSAEMLTRIVTVTNASTPYYLVGQISYTGGPLNTASAYTNFYAV